MTVYDDSVISIIICRMKGEVTFSFKATWFPSPLALLTPLILAGETGVRTTFSYAWVVQRPPHVSGALGARCGS